MRQNLNLKCKIIISGYKNIYVQQNFKNAETIARVLWDRRGHQSDETGKNDEGELPSFAKAFLNILSSPKRGEQQTTLPA